MSIEQDLHRAFRRKPAPADFADRVLARVAASDRRRSAGWRPRMVRWLAAAAAITLTATGGVRYYTYQQTLAEAERVKQDIRLALQITSETLALAQERIAQSVDHSRQGTRP
jgi:hypothetical protein